MKVTSNARKIAKRLRARIRTWDDRVKDGLRRIVTKVDREQVKNLSGSNADAPGSYPVPDRTGTLLRGHFSDVKSSRLALVGNTTEYALAIHSGNMTTKNGVQYALRPRPFLQDAADKVDAAEEMALALRQSVIAL
jgi:phage gpG-like protein